MRYLFAAAFVATVWLANWLLTTYGVVTIAGLAMPAGVFAAGLGFVLRDALQETGGRLWVVGCILVGACLSWWVGADVTLPGGAVPIAVASGCAFLLAELADFAVYTPLRERTLTGAVGLSQVVGSAADSLIFLWLAFGSLAFFWGQFWGKTLMVLPAVLVLAAWRFVPRTRFA